MNRTGKKIFIFTNTLKAGGAERQSIYLTKALLIDNDVNLIVYYGDQFDPSYRDLTTDFSNKVIWLYGNHISKLYRLYKLLKNKKKSVLISYLATTNIVNAVIGSIAGVDVKIGGIRNSLIQKYKMVVQRFLHNKILSHTISNNYAAYEYLKENGFNSNKLTVIQNCIGNIPEYFSRRECKGPIKILSLSRFEPQKDLIIALEAIKILKETLGADKFQYILSGYGSEEQNLKKFIEKNRLEGCVKMVIKPDVNQVLKEANIFINTSLFEGTSNSIMEAMTFGLPIVATDVGDSKYLIENGKTGYICKVGDYFDIAQKLKLIIESDDLRNSFGRNSYDKIKSEFSVEKMLSSYTDLINKNTN